MESTEQLRKIVDGGYCIGCGVCSHATKGALPIIMDQHRQYKADVSKLGDLTYQQGSNALEVCPFSNAGPNEDIIAEDLYSGTCSHQPTIGYHAGLYIGHVAEGAFRANGSSGGVITWLLTELLDRDLVDKIIHVKAVTPEAGGVIFKYAVSTTAPEILAGAKSRYYPIETSEILKIINNHPGRYVFVGLPCFVKAIRRLQRQDPVIRDRIKFCIGLVCGHLKSAAFADCFAWQAGIKPGNLKTIDFRIKLPDRGAGDYGIHSQGTEKEDTRPTKDLLGSNWGYNFFRNSACDFCDDVFAETADAVVGDAWLPAYERDGAGNSVVVVRHSTVGKLIQDGIKNGRLNFDESTHDQISLSQAGGLRDRREGLGYRISRKIRAGKWYPTKRFPAATHKLPIFRRLIYLLRTEAGQASHQYWREAVKKDDLHGFIKNMTLLTNNINRCYHPRLRFAVLFLSLAKLISKDK